MATRKKGDGKLNGSQKAAIILMSIDSDSAAKVFSMLGEDEIREISHAMSTLGSMKSDMVENLMMEFINQISEGGDLVGGFEQAEKLLQSAQKYTNVPSLCIAQVGL